MAKVACARMGWIGREATIKNFQHTCQLVLLCYWECERCKVFSYSVVRTMGVWWSQILKNAKYRILEALDSDGDDHQFLMWLFTRERFFWLL